MTILILTGCNVGHQDYRWENIAYEFSQKISGCVVASDATVYWNTYYDAIGEASYESKADGEYNKWCNNKNNRGRSNLGWIVYKDKRNEGITTCYWNNIYELTFSSIFEHLKNHQFYK